MKRWISIALSLAIAGLAMAQEEDAQEQTSAPIQAQPKTPEQPKVPPRKTTTVQGLPLKAEDMLKQGEDLWEMTSEAFMEEFSKNRFRLDAKTKTARATALGGAEITISGQPVLETIATFKNDKLAEIIFTIYTRAEIGSWTLDRHQKMVTAVTQGINRFTGVSAPPSRIQDGSLAKKMQTATWVKRPNRIVGEWGFSELLDKSLQPELIRVSVTPFDAEAEQPQQVAAQPINIAAIRAALPSKVTSDDEGNVSIREIPRVADAMRRSGPCVVLERLLKHFELPVDSHVLDQIDNASRDKVGTAQLVEMVKKAAPFLRCKAEEIVPVDLRRWERLSVKYNAAALKADLQPSVWTANNPDLQRFYASVNPRLFRELQAKDETIKTLMPKIRTNINQGIPLIWVVLMTPTENEQARDAYFRIITGYNAKSNEILYMEFWGSAYSMRRMPLENAWAITVSIIAFSPSR